VESFLCPWQKKIWLSVLGHKVASQSISSDLMSSNSILSVLLYVESYQKQHFDIITTHAQTLTVSEQNRVLLYVDTYNGYYRHGQVVRKRYKGKWPSDQSYQAVASRDLWRPAQVGWGLNNLFSQLTICPGRKVSTATSVHL
jgi:hypothetical protein